MGKKILDRLKDGAKAAAGKAADGVTAAAQLSPSQVAAIEACREAYFKEQDDRAGDKTLGAIGVEVFHAYLPQISQLYCPVRADWDSFRPENRIRWFDITKWVVDASEQSLDKLTNVYQVLAGEACTIALIYERRKDGCTVSLAVENTSESDQPTTANGLCGRLQSAICGNFPGAELGAHASGVPKALRNLPDGCAIAAVSNLASEKSENFISQSMEKLLDGIVPRKADENYTIILLAQPAPDPQAVQCRLYKLYSELSSFASWQENQSLSDALMMNASANVGANAGGNVGFNHNVNGNASVGAHIPFVNAGTSVGASHGVNFGFNFGVNFSRSASMSRTATVTNGITRSHTDYAIQHTMELIERQVRRLEQCAALGMWNFAAYVLSPDYAMVNNVAHMYLSLTQGEESYMERAAVNIWPAKRAGEIRTWLNYLRHPLFALSPELDEEWLMYPAQVSVTTPLSGDELARALNFPRKSVSGLPVYECVPFGREVVQYSVDPKAEKIRLGCIYHMRRPEQAEVSLDRESLSSHVFITGSTGAGKSTAIYTILKQLCLKGQNAAKFLVIEPAKGEYKDILGGYPGVAVYGTNPGITKLLRLNPFSFPPEVHVLEHTDRLIEIFNACWPMYAAMPAVLKAAVENAYLSCGWSLHASKSVCGRFPTFQDVMRALPAVVDNKNFSKDTQGDYKGALLTRIESLTNGINGQVLCSEDELSMEELFDGNVIVDLSRVGSPETKALLMGVLILKLQEHRMSQRARRSGAANQGLGHVTVLEEAHSLLRRTSNTQSQESANLQGKSVEMLTNAIAEMRTYGEGFIIADQAPGLLDMAAIRNTNTKIVLRLPDESDRQLVGRAAGLSDGQIAELARLDRGVAAVFQNHWLEPVLCAVDPFTEERRFTYEGPAQAGSPEVEALLIRVLQGTSDDKEMSRETIDYLDRWIDRLDIIEGQKHLLRQVMLAKRPLSEEEKGKLLFFVANGRVSLRQAEYIEDPVHARAAADQQIIDLLRVSTGIAEQIRAVAAAYADSWPECKGKYRALYNGGIR